MGLDSLLTLMKGEVSGVSREPTICAADAFDTPQKSKTKIEAMKIGTGDTALSVGWRLHYVDRDPMHVFCAPPATHAEILERYPYAIAAEPCTLADVPDGAEVPESTDDRRPCRDCRHFSRDFRTDRDHRNGTTPRSGMCLVASPSGPVVANRGYRPTTVNTPHRCAGFVEIGQ